MKKLAQQQQHERLREATGSNAIEVRAGGKTTCIEHHVVEASIHVLVDECGHLLPERVEDGERHMRAAWETVADGGRPVSGSI